MKHNFTQIVPVKIKIDSLLNFLNKDLYCIQEYLRKDCVKALHSFYIFFITITLNKSRDLFYFHCYEILTTSFQI